MSEAIIQIAIQGQKTIEGKAGQSLWQILTGAGVLLEAVCGGKGTCGKCKVHVLSGQVVDRNGNPAQISKEGTYLACQVYPQGQVVLAEINPKGTTAKGKIGQIDIPSEYRKSSLKKSVIQPAYPTLTQNYALETMLRKALEKDLGEELIFELVALKELALLASGKTDKYTIVHWGNKVFTVEAEDTASAFYGVAFDLGTTTVAGMLININSGEVIAAAAETNPQTVYGADVISRIKVAERAEGLRKLSDAIRQCLNSLIGKLCKEAGITRHDIYFITLVGNSTMEHLLMNISPTSLTTPPYAQVFQYLPILSPQDISLDINPGGCITLLPNITSFVGADTTAAIMAVDQDLTDKLTLLIDLGTNGEIALGNRKRLLVTSTAAGPAFEGAQLSCGMRATGGAIDDVKITDNVTIHTIKNQKPAGICGSGIIKALAEMLRAGIVTPSGGFAGEDKVARLPAHIQTRFREHAGQKEFVLAFAEESANGSDIVITQGDIREIQLVKSSIYTGSQILMEALGVGPEAIEQVFLAGAFGSYVDLDSALAIGLIPVQERQKIRSVGNAAGEGAAKALLSSYNLQRCHKIASKAEFLELANNPLFQKRFIKNLAFPVAN